MTLMKRERNSEFAVPVNKTFLADHPEIRQSGVDPGMRAEEGGEAGEKGVTVTDLDISTVQPLGGDQWQCSGGGKPVNQLR